MIIPVRRLRWNLETPNIDDLLDREWLVTNGRGGYASGTVAGVPTRRFHGMLVAALPAPVGRAMMLSELAETISLPDGTVIRLAGYEHHPNTRELDVTRVLSELRIEGGCPVWSFHIGRPGARFVIEKRLHMINTQNTTVVRYRLLEGPEEQRLRVELRPFVSFRPHEGPVAGPDANVYEVRSHGHEHEIHGPASYPPLRLRVWGEPSRFVLDTEARRDVLYRIERGRGYDWLGSTWSPGLFQTELARGEDVVLVASAEEWDTVRALTPEEAIRAEVLRRARLVQQAAPERDPSSRQQEIEAGSLATLADELVCAADTFVIRPGSRQDDAIRAAAAGDEPRSIIAGYHWFTDWGRDTMISLEGLTLTTGRWLEAGYILRTFARYVKDGLIPNMFPEGETEGLYHTADATLWFFHALDRYTTITRDRLTLRSLLPLLRGIVEAHQRGTRFGIHVDPEDGLVSQGAEGYQLTWMDAKVDGWVVTPRRGKPVEINALWYNALTLLARWLRDEDSAAAARPFEDAAERARDAFNRRFWYGAGHHLYDVIDGPERALDPSLRPNQIFAVSLPNPVLDESRWRPVVEIVERELLTPVGLRSLGREEPDYQPRYSGDLRARDAAYHQGTVWSWLIGPFVDAWLRVHPGRAHEATRFLEGFGPHLDEACIGSVSEIFDAEPPYHPRGCVAQAWGVAEVLRALAKTLPDWPAPRQR